MSKIVTDSKNYSDIADAIREKGVKGSFKPAEMADAVRSIPSGGGSIPEMTLIIDKLSTSGVPAECTWYGNEIPDHTLRYFGYQSRRLLKKGTSITRIGTQALGNATIDVEEGFFDDVIYLGNYACCFSPSSVIDLSFPKWNGKDVGNKLPESNFRGTDIKFNSLNLPMLEHVPQYMCYQNKLLTHAQLGSIGHGIISSGQRPFGNTQGTATIEVYVDGSNLDSISAAVSNSASSSYTFIFKASENTTYNGTSYSAGDTMLTIGS